MAGIYSQGGSAGHRYAGWLSKVEAKNFQFGGKVFNGSPSAIYVGSKMVWANWLKDATKQAILGAFGATDGAAVIAATNAYLNALAAQGAAGQSKATALAGFINEDPMMVCSLGLEPDLTVLPAMPWRLLKGGGTAYIDTGYYNTNSSKYRLRFQYTTTGSGWYGTYFGAGTVYNSSDCVNVAPYSGNLRCRFGNEYYTLSLTLGHVYELEMSRLRIVLKDLTTGSENAQTISAPTMTSSDRNIRVFAADNSDSDYSKKTTHPILYWGVEDNESREMYPFIRKVNNVATLGMIDVLHDVLYTNAGSGQFTEEFGYMLNGSWVTWTPSTP